MLRSTRLSLSDNPKGDKVFYKQKYLEAVEKIVRLQDDVIILNALLANRVLPTMQNATEAQNAAMEALQAQQAKIESLQYQHDVEKAPPKSPRRKKNAD